MLKCSSNLRYKIKVPPEIYENSISVISTHKLSTYLTFSKDTLHIWLISVHKRQVSENINKVINPNYYNHLYIVIERFHLLTQ